MTNMLKTIYLIKNLVNIYIYFTFNFWKRFIRKIFVIDFILF